MAVKSSKNTISGSYFRAFINEWADKSGKKKNELSFFLGLSPSNFGDYLHGVKSPSLAVMEEIAEKIGVDLADMLIEGRAILEASGPLPVAEIEPAAPPPPDGTDLGDIKALLAKLTVRDDHMDIKTLLAKQIEVTMEHSSAMKEVVAEALAAAIKHVRNEEHEKALADKEIRIRQLERDIEELKDDRNRLRTKVEGNILTLIRKRGAGGKNAA